MRAFLIPALNAVVAVNLAAMSLPAAYAQSASPTCQRLEAQLASLDRGNADPQRAERIRRAEDAVNRQQYEVDRLVSQSRQNGCESSGFFSIFSNPPPQCGGITRQIGQQRSTLERLQVELEQLTGGNTERMAQRQSLLIALGDNNCGAQYRSAAIQGQQGGFFDRLFGGNTNSGIFSTPQGPMGGTYRTICVRSCDGYYFPISYATSPDRFNDDAQACQRMCPAAQVQLYTYHNPGEEVNQAVSLDGRPYTDLPTAFAYRKALDKSCSCRRPGESWAEAMKVMGGDQTVAPGDVVVTEESAKRLSLPRGTDGRPVRPQTPAQNPAQGQPQAATSAPSNDVRSVGPSFVPQRQQ